MKTIYRHYGSDHFDNTLVKPIKNRDTWGKPSGGFWASSVDAKVSWREWCESEDYNMQKLKKSFDFTLRDNAKILHIKSKADFEKIKHEHPDWFIEPKWGFIEKAFLDFEKLSNLFDAIEINAGSDRELYFNFYGWDCDSIVIFNLNCVEYAKEKEQ